MSRTSLASAAIALLLASNTALAQQGHQGQQGRDVTTFTWSRQMAADSRITVRNGNGPIVVREAQGDKLEVRATKVARRGGSITDVAFDVRESGGDVEICTLYDRQSACGDRGGRDTRVRVDFTVLVPRTMRVNFSTGNGDVSIDRAGADVTATTGNGKITIGETTGRVHATSGNGDVDIQRANGPVDVTTGNGRVMVTTAQGPVNASTGNGSVDVRMQALAAASDMSFSSGSGAIRITFPSDFNGRIDASTGNGSLRSDFEISVLGRLDSQHVRGTIGKGGALVRLNTGNGSIEIRKTNP